MLILLSFILLMKYGTSLVSIGLGWKFKENTDLYVDSTRMAPCLLFSYPFSFFCLTILPQALFEIAREQQPSVIFFDEIDALMSVRKVRRFIVFLPTFSMSMLVNRYAAGEFVNL